MYSDLTNSPPTGFACTFAVIVLLSILLVPPSMGQARPPANVVPLREAIKMFESSSGYTLTYRDNLVADVRIDKSAVALGLQGFLNALKPFGIDSKIDNQAKSILLIELTPLHRQPIHGRIIDVDTGSSLPFATLSWQGRTYLDGVAGSASGTFRIEADEVLNATSPVPVTISYIGYEQRTIEVVAGESGAPLLIKLTPKDTFVPEVVVSDIGFTSDLDTAFVAAMDPRLASPLGEANVIKSLQTLPSVSLTYGLSSGVNVRGTRSDGFQILLDGIPIYNQSHFFGMFDALNEDALKSVGFFYGVSPSNLQGPPGGTLAFATKSGSREAVEQSYGLSNTSAKMTIGGPLPASFGTWIVSLRRSIMSEIDWFNNSSLIEQGLDVSRPTSVTRTFANRRDAVLPGDGSASYYDVHAKLGFDVAARTRLAVSGYSGSDKGEQEAKRFLPIRDPGPDDPRAAIADVATSYSWSNDLLATRLLHSTSSGVLLTTNVGLSRYRNRYSKDDFLYSIPSADLGQGIERTIIDTLSNVNSLQDLVVSQEGSIAVTRGDVVAGVSAHIYAMEFSEDSAIRLRPYSENVNASLAEVHAEYRTLLKKLIGVQLGARAHYYSNGSFLRLSPRLKIEMGSRLISVYGGYSRNYQFLHRLYVENTVGSYLWTISRAGEPPGVADNFVAGITIRPASSLVIQIDGYQKQFQNLRQHESVVTRRRLVTAGAVLSPWVHNTKGDARGLEVLTRFRLGVAAFTNSYALTESTSFNETIQDGRTFPAEWDRPHQFSSRISISVGRSMLLDATFSLASGAPNVLSFVDETEPARLSTYHRLDLGIEFRRSFRHVSSRFRASVFNAYDRDNAWYRTRVAALVTDRFRDGVEFVNADVYDLGIQPSFDWRIRF